MSHVRSFLYSQLRGIFIYIKHILYIKRFLLRKSRKNKSFEKQIKRSIEEVIATRLLLIRRFRDPPLAEE